MLVRGGTIIGGGTVLVRGGYIHRGGYNHRVRIMSRTVERVWMSQPHVRMELVVDGDRG